MKVKVNRDACIGCGACAAICPDVFEIDDEGLSKAKKEIVDENDKKDLLNIVESCPVSAIVIEDEKEA